MPDHAMHTSHREWVRGSIRDALGVTDAGGTVVVTPELLDHVAEVARRETLNWAVAAAKNGQIKHSESDDV